MWKGFRMVTEIDTEKFLDRIAQKAGDYEEAAVSCSQGTFAALQEGFDLGGGTAMIKAATIMPGVASRKETCGAVLGGLMALGIKFGKDKIHDAESVTPAGKAEILASRQRAWRFCEDFKREFGSTMCGDIRPIIMGRDYNSMEPIERQQFLDDGGPKKCRVVAEKAARIVASIILEKS